MRMKRGLIASGDVERGGEEVRSVVVVVVVVVVGEVGGRKMGRGLVLVVVVVVVVVAGAPSLVRFTLSCCLCIMLSTMPLRLAE